METVTRTIWGSALQTAQLLGRPYVLGEKTTLNERFNVQSGTSLPSGQYPRLQYFCIGTGGVKLIAGSDGNPRSQNIQHRATDVSCYKPMPFILRLATNDLSVAERAKYALRVQETHNSVNYIAYYLKRIDLSQVTVRLEKRVVNDGVTTTSAFTATQANLVPTPPTITNTGANIVTSDYVTASSQLAVTLSPADCQELQDAATILYGSSEYAIISEIGLCSGLDKVISLTNGSSFTEAIGVQIVSHINTLQSVRFSSGGINGLYDVGTAEPLLSLT